jgi:hypothetical protein
MPEHPAPPEPDDDAPVDTDQKPALPIAPPANGRDEPARGGKPTPTTRADRRAEIERDLKSLTPEQKKELARLNRFVFSFGVGALVAMVGLSLPVPWPAIGLAALVFSAVLAIRGIKLARRTPLARGVIVYLSMGLGLLAMFSVYATPVVITWGEQLRYQQCLRQTQTIEGADACRDKLEQATKSDWTRILRQLRD